jgi:hypothetical protein
VRQVGYAGHIVSSGADGSCIGAGESAIGECAIGAGECAIGDNQSTDA